MASILRNINGRLFSKERWEEILNKDISYHIFFWVSLYVILVVLDNKGTLSFILLKEFFNVAFFAAMVYINIELLFPNYLQSKNLLKHILSLAVIALLITPIKILSLFLIASRFGDFQAYFITHRLEIFLSTFFIGIASTIYSIMNDWLATQREKKELQNQTLQSELKFLKSQINPHFLFNTLNSLYALTLKKSDKAPETVLKLSEMMRYMLYECNEREVSLQKEVNYLKNYLELEKIRHGKKMGINLKINGEITNQKIAPLIFIPFVENSFKHGLSNQITEGFVNIEMHIVDLKVRMDIENSKAPALPSPSSKKSGGIGLKNVKRRLSLLYPEKFVLDIEETPDTYKVHITIDLE